MMLLLLSFALHAEKPARFQLAAEVPLRSLVLEVTPEVRDGLKPQKLAALEHAFWDLVMPVDPSLTTTPALDLVLDLVKVYSLSGAVHEITGRLYLRDAQGSPVGRWLPALAIMTNRSPNGTHITFPKHFEQIDNKLEAKRLERAKQIAEQLLRPPTCGERLVEVLGGFAARLGRRGA